MENMHTDAAKVWMANKTYSSCSTYLHSVMKMGEREMFGKPKKKLEISELWTLINLWRFFIPLDCQRDSWQVC